VALAIALASLALHWGLFRGADTLSRSERLKEKQQLQVAVVEKKPEQPPPPPPKPKPPEPKPDPKPELKPVEPPPVPEIAPPEPEPVPEVKPPEPVKPEPTPEPVKPEPAPEPEIKPEPAPEPARTPDPQPAATAEPAKPFDPPPEDKPAGSAPPVVGLSLESTATGGKSAINVGNTAGGAVSGTATDPSAVRPGTRAGGTGTGGSGTGTGGTGTATGPRPQPLPPGVVKADTFIPAYQLPKMGSTPAKFLNNVPESVMERFFPAAARRDEVEDQVVMKLTIDSDGTVVAAKVVRWSRREYEFDKASVELARMYRFSPAIVAGKAVATEIVFTINWELPY